MDREFYVYILANLRGKSPVLHTGMTNDIARRLAEPGQGRSRFTGRYHVTTLVYVEWSNGACAAIAREKQIKGWNRAKKNALIEAKNPTWRDLHLESQWGLPSEPVGDPSLSLRMTGCGVSPHKQ